MDLAFSSSILTNSPVSDMYILKQSWMAFPPRGNSVMLRLWQRRTIPASSIHCKLPMYSLLLPPLRTIEYVNFLFSRLSWRGIDSKHSRMRDFFHWSKIFSIFSAIHKLLCISLLTKNRAIFVLFITLFRATFLFWLTLFRATSGATMEKSFDFPVPKQHLMI